MIDSIAPAPTLRTAPSPKRIRRSPTTVNLKPDSFTSGGSTSSPSSRASLMYCTTLSVLPISEREQRRHELGRVVRLEPRGLVGQDRVRHRVRLVEAVAAEGLDLRGRAPRPASAGGPSAMARSTNLPSSFLISSASFLPTAFRSTSASARREARQHVGDAHHLFLVGDDAVGRLQDLLQRRVRVGHRLLAQLPPDEDGVHPGVERARAGAGRWRRRGRRSGRTSWRAASRWRAATRTGRRRRCGPAGAARRPWGRRTAARPCRAPCRARPRSSPRASWITVSVLRPSMSILSMPTFSSAPISYCVMIDVFAVGGLRPRPWWARCRPARSRAAGPARSPRRRRAPTGGARSPRSASSGPPAAVHRVRSSPAPAARPPSCTASGIVRL